MTFQRLESPTELPTDAGMVVIDEVDLAPDTEWVLRGINVERVPTDQPIRWDKYGIAHFDHTDRWNLDRRDEMTEKLLAWVEAIRHPEPRKQKV